MLTTLGSIVATLVAMVVAAVGFGVTLVCQVWTLAQQTWTWGHPIIVNAWGKIHPLLLQSIEQFKVWAAGIAA